ncbi:hypothetical protein Sxan_78430 [Streptomyces xanthophaeus]|uniref:Uncharacterized protein n=1 Tax=Streptomyces xanthophaeus TaxID=67385 RepID=A0A919H6M4_9ACTN|nr:hypothetical protein Sxan_78430 [Streptomyces xanthophaeus]
MLSRCLCRSAAGGMAGSGRPGGCPGPGVWGVASVWVMSPGERPQGRVPSDPYGPAWTRTVPVTVQLKRP